MIFGIASAALLFVGAAAGAAEGSEDLRSQQTAVAIPLEKPSHVRFLDRRPGGLLLAHWYEAMFLLASGDYIEVLNDQYSAAAMQVLYIKSKAPDRICSFPGVNLHFHLPYNALTKEAIEEPNWLFKAFIQPKNLERLGTLPQFGMGWKTVKAVDFLGQCKD